MEIIKTLRSTRETEEKLDTVDRLNNLSRIATEMENLLQKHFEVEKERLKERSNKNITGRGPILISPQMERDQIAQLMQLFVEKKVDKQRNNQS